MQGRAIAPKRNPSLLRHISLLLEWKSANPPDDQRFVLHDASQ